MNAISKFEPKITQEFWCSVCDGKIVRSNDKSTGQFYAVHGDVWNAKKQDTDKYVMVIFAVCPDCKDQIVEK